jgi:hypothetical protein
LSDNKAYTVRIPNIKTGPTATLVPVSKDTGEGANADINDSDYELAGNVANVAVVASDLPSTGANNHSFDFGFSPVIAHIDIEKDTNGTQADLPAEAIEVGTGTTVT